MAATKMHSPRTSGWRGKHSQRGQSLTEVAIAGTVMVPLFLGIWLLGQYMHVRQQTQASARSAAWDAAVSPTIVTRAGAMPSSTDAQTRARALQFGTVDQNLRNITAPARLLDPMLTTFAGRDLVESNKVQLRTYSNGKSPALSEAALGPLGGVTGGVGLGSFPPDNDGLISAEVHVVPEHIVGTNGLALKFLNPLDTLDMDFHGRTVLLADAWNANGAGENVDGEESGAAVRTVRKAIRPLTPVDWMPSNLSKVVNSAFDLLGRIPVIDDIFVPNANQLNIGQTSPDVVPADKLVRYGSSR